MEKEVVEKEKKTTKQKVKFWLTIVGNVLFYSIIILLFLFSIMNINGGNGTTNFPNLFGSGWLSVKTDSMKRSPNYPEREEWKDYAIGGFQEGDLLTDRVFNETTTENLKVGDVITFVFNKDGQNVLNTHRIVFISPDGKSVVTQGDARAQIQPYDTSGTTEAAKYNYQLESSGAIESVSVENIRGVVVGVSAGKGVILNNIRDYWLFYFVIPVAVILLFEIFLVVKNLLDLRAEKNKAALADDKEAMMAELEAEKEKMRQELLAELKAQQQAPVETDEPKEDASVEEDNQPEEDVSTEEETDSEEPSEDEEETTENE